MIGIILFWFKNWSFLLITIRVYLIQHSKPSNHSGMLKRSIWFMQFRPFQTQWRKTMQMLAWFFNFAKYQWLNNRNLLLYWSKTCKVWYWIIVACSNLHHSKRYQKVYPLHRNQYANIKTSKVVSKKPYLS